MSKTPVYNMTLKKSKIELVPGMKINQIKPHLEELYGHMAESNTLNKGIYKEQEWVAGYATIYCREAINKIGLFDTNFKNGCEDLDLCKRLKKYNYKIGQSLDSFVFHFGGVTRGKHYNLTKGKDNSKVFHFSISGPKTKEKVLIKHAPNPRIKKEFKVQFNDYEIKGRGAGGNIITKHPIKKVNPNKHF